MKNLEEVKNLEEPTELNTLNVIPGYGRDYRTKEQVVAAWNAGKDFLIQHITHRYDGRYINLGDAKQYGVLYIRVRFNKKRNIHLIKITVD